MPLRVNSQANLERMQGVSW